MDTKEKNLGKIEVFETVLKPLTDEKEGNIYCRFCGCLLGTKDGYRHCKCDKYEQAYTANVHAGHALLHKRGQAKLSHIPHPGD